MSVAVLVNVQARHGSDALGDRIASILPAARVAVTHSLEDAQRWVRDVLRHNPPRVLLSGGGDGTAVALLNELRTQQVDVPVFGLLPLGTGNAWARATGELSQRAVLEGLGKLREGQEPPVRNFRLVETCGRVTPFAGTGWDAQILADYKSMRQDPSTPLATMGGASAGYLRSVVTRTIPRNLFRREIPRVRVINTGEPALTVNDYGNPIPMPGGESGAVLYEGPISVGGASTTCELGLGFRGFPFAHLVPDRMAVRVYAGSPAEATMRLPWLWRGAHPIPNDHNFFVTKCRFEFDREVPFEIGGDLSGHEREVELSLVRESVSLVNWRKLLPRRK
jgi:hypothetical protein